MRMKTLAFCWSGVIVLGVSSREGRSSGGCQKMKRKESFGRTATAYVSAISIIRTSFVAVHAMTLSYEPLVRLFVKELALFFFLTNANVRHCVELSRTIPKFRSKWLRK
jgi:hypothetical protein